MQLAATADAEIWWRHQGADGAVLAVVAAGRCSAKGAPNVLLIMSDDEGYSVPDLRRYNPDNVPGGELAHQATIDFARRQNLIDDFRDKFEVYDLPVIPQAAAWRRRRPPASFFLASSSSAGGRSRYR